MRALQPSDRTVVVSGALQGSGVLLTDRLVLTCAHVVKSSNRCHLAHPDVTGPVPATVAWIDHDLDAALLQTSGPVLPVGPARLGLVDTRQAMADCEITGFPRIQRYGTEKNAEADQYTATVLPMAGRMRDLLVCDLDGPPVTPSDQELSGLAGLSGGPVFARGTSCSGSPARSPVSGAADASNAYRSAPCSRRSRSGWSTNRAAPGSATRRSTGISRGTSGTRRSTRPPSAPPTGVRRSSGWTSWAGTTRSGTWTRPI
ncbi:trypsin-like peptidase domain-containing protein [Streptomyces sp. QL37]|uniref:S1 family peptidase n=1 Tax=Streptomyces sp. QL37 TaxID=2093747 RepID=UPI002915C6FA|nr:trypsin-like peptidase domain-containing protein [Streptomyces sp. QL37]